ncbi:MAG TPA: DUF3300 domain-containing protein [Terracidiphilus sp.]|nr:DUF3300 domain-containing protein [Terracidiphilus sp.]
MKSRTDLLALRSASLAVPAPAGLPVKILFGLAAASLLLPGAVRLRAQQDWPPDDNYAPQPQQPYSPQQAYGNAPQPGYGYAPQNQGGYQNYAPQNYAPQDDAQQQGYAQQPLSPEQLTQLVAPIALYPDALVAQILAASTYPAQVSAADQWLRSMGNAPAEQIAAGADAQTSWDPSVKALTAFPQVLAMLDQNLQWTTALGNAYYNQPQDVMQTIQVMRQRAEDAGNLESTPQQQVYDDDGAIDIAPADQQEVYVPSYDPWDVYGAPVDPYPGFSFIGAVGSWIGSGIGSGFIRFWPGVLLSAFWHLPWGWGGWGCDWYGHSVLYHRGDYWTHSASVRDWGFPHSGPRWRGGGYGYGHGYDRGARAFNGNGGRNGVRPRGGPAQPMQRWGDARTVEGFNRGFPGRQQTWGRPAMPTGEMYGRGAQTFNNRSQAYAPRQQNYGSQYARPGYGSGFRSEPRSTYQPRAGGGMAFANPGYRAPQNSYRPESAYRGSMQPRSYGGYSGSYGGRSAQPRSFSGGGHSGWGGGGGYKAPHESHSFSGGGHSFGGGGHSFGGGHSSGGGSHGGGGHHR